ncbi:type II secretion system F family protein [Shewanella sp. ALD9]|uniref:type II secretion system F family protein n=1 Tax=unclassified Shewanella TaxID=196818 RepID=UPI000C32C8A8|nr:type II secretion system F family protein [Shewanella sp. ALD9]PKH32637.1 secretion system protein [Shewanella sp. ALD9]
MNTSLFTDLILGVLLVLTCWLFYLFHNTRVDDKDITSFGDLLPLDNIYPANLIRQAGLSVFRNRLLYWSIKISLAITAVIMVLEFMPTMPVWLHILVSVIAFFMLDGWLLLKRQMRKQRIDASLEFFISLLVVYLQSGTPLSQAFRLSAKYGLTKEHPLADELLLLSLELESGRDRQRAFADLAKRTGVQNLNKLAAIINIGLQIGSPLINCLQSQLSAIQQQRQQLVNSKINRKSLEVLLPMLLVCFPMFLVLVFFPAAIQFMDLLSVLADSL